MWRSNAGEVRFEGTFVHASRDALTLLYWTVVPFLASEVSEGVSE
jgi:hypothetical protein